MKKIISILSLLTFSSTIYASTTYYTGDSGAYSGGFSGVTTNEYLISENATTLRVCGINIRYDGTVRGYIDYTFEIKGNPSSDYQNLVSEDKNVGTYKEGSFIKFSMALLKEDPEHFFNEFRFIKGNPNSTVYYREVGAFSGELSAWLETQESPSETLKKFCK